MGGLTAQYSSSMPNSGGYFAADVRGGANEELTERRQREKERELKRKAMQAAWGVDAPEPYEEFGYSTTTPTQEDTVELGDEALPLPAPSSTRPLRSPGLRMARHSSYVAENDALPSSQDYFGTSPDGGEARSPGGGGVKRTKSLMQKIKAMRENPNIPLGVGSPRGASPSRQSADEYATQRTSNSSPTDDSGSVSTQGGAGTNVPPPPAPKARRNSFLHRRRPSKPGLTPPLPDSPEMNEEALNALEPWEEQLNYGNATTALPSTTRTPSISTSGNNGGFASLIKTTSRSKSGNREKGLPPPPAQPVMPDFADLRSGTTGGGGGEAGRIRFESNEKGDSEGFSGESGLRRKTSLVKKLKDRMTR